MTQQWVVLGIWCGLAPAALAQTVPGPAAQPEAAPGLVCVTTGYDLVLINQTAEPLQAGITLVWTVPFVRLQGSHVLDRDLVPGGMVHLTGALVSTYLAKPKPCQLERGPILGDTPD